MSTSRSWRSCRSCGGRLAADNRMDLCSPCLRRSELEPATAGPRMPDEFWDQPELRAALEQRHFGRVVKAYRQARGGDVTQALIARWLGVSQVQVSRIERGRSAVNDLQKLDRWARSLRIPPDRLWFTLSPQTSDAYRDQASTPNLPPATDSDGDDVRRRQFLKAAGVGVSLLTGSVAASKPANSTSAPGSPDVETVREMTNTFRRLDNKFGGGHSRTAANAFLSSTVEPLIRDGRHKNGVKAELFSATAELHQLLGWMAYDTGQVQAGRKHLQYALRLCQNAGNDALAAEMLAGMSHHAAFFGAPEAAVDLALAARQTAKGAGLLVLCAEAAVMEAHGLALQGDKAGCLAALRDAEQLFTRNSSDIPLWLGYFDEAYLAAKFAHTFRDLSQPREAEQFALRSLEMSDGYERGRLFNLALLASTQADLRRIDEACATATLAVQMADTVRSTRTASYLADVARRLAPFRANVEVRALYERMANAGILTTAAGMTQSISVKR